MAGEECPLFTREPKAMLGRAFWPTGPPLGICPLVPEALITTEGFLPWLSVLVKSDPAFCAAALPVAAAAGLEGADIVPGEPFRSNLPCCTGA